MKSKITSYILLFFTATLVLGVVKGNNFSEMFNVNSITREMSIFILKFFRSINQSSSPITSNCVQRIQEMIIKKIIPQIILGDNELLYKILLDFETNFPSSCIKGDINGLTKFIFKFDPDYFEYNLFDLYQFLSNLKLNEIEHLSDIGDFLGKFFNYFVQKRPASISPSSFKVTWNTTDFVIGYIDGLSDVPIERNKLFKSVKKFLPLIEHRFNKYLKAITLKRGLAGQKQKITALFLTLELLLNGFISKHNKCFSKETISQFDFKSYLGLNYFLNFIDELKTRNLWKSGRFLGMFIQSYCDIHTN